MPLVGWPHRRLQRGSGRPAFHTSKIARVARSKWRFLRRMGRAACQTSKKRPFPPHRSDVWVASRSMDIRHGAFRAVRMRGCLANRPSDARAASRRLAGVIPARHATGDGVAPRREDARSQRHRGVVDRYDRRVAAGEDRGSVRARLGWPADPATLRRIRRLWQRHSIAEDRRDIDGLIATLAPECVYDIVGDGPALEASRRRPRVLHGAVRGVSGQQVRAHGYRHRAAGRVRGGRPRGDPPRAIRRACPNPASRAPAARDPVSMEPRGAAVRRRADLHRSGSAHGGQLTERA